MSEQENIHLDTEKIECSENMKYAFLTVEYANKEMEFDDVWRFFGYETVKKHDKIVVEFEYDKDNPNKLLVYDAELVHCPEITATTLKTSHTKFPCYFLHVEKSSFSKTYFYKMPKKEELFYGVKYTIPISMIFKNCNMAKKKKMLASIYNCIYTYRTKAVFSLVKITDTNTRSNFIIAYDDTHISAENAVYMAKTILL